MYIDVNIYKVKEESRREWKRRVACVRDWRKRFAMGLSHVYVRPPQISPSALVPPLS